MDVKAQAHVPDPPGKSSSWTTARAAGKYDDSGFGETQPASIGVGTLDNVRAVFWQAYRHLFPPHSLAAQTSSGNIVISWSVMDDPHAHHPYAAPVMLRFDEDLLDTMWKADPRTRIRIALHHEAALREGMRGYDPFARSPDARVIQIG